MSGNKEGKYCSIYGVFSLKRQRNGRYLWKTGGWASIRWVVSYQMFQLSSWMIQGNSGSNS